MSLLRRAIERRQNEVVPDPYAIPPNSAFYDSWAGMPVSERMALQQLTVWSCVFLISDSLAILDPIVYRDENGQPKPVQAPSVITDPHAEMDRFEWVSRLAVSLIMRGNAYGHIIERDGRGFPTQVQTLHPDQVYPWRDLRTGKLTYRIIAGQTMADTLAKDVIDPVDMMHIRGLTLPGPWSIVGLSPIEYARQTIGTSLAAEQFGAEFFGSGAQPSGVLQSDHKLDEDSAKRYQEMLLERHGARQRTPLVLGSGLKWQTISLKPDEAQFLETIKAKREEIMGFFRVPPHMLSHTEKATSWGTGIEEQMLGFVTFTLGPWIKRFESKLAALLPRPLKVQLDTADYLRGKVLDRFNAYQIGRLAGFLNSDEIRAKEKLPPIPGGLGQDYYQSFNYIPLNPDGTPATGAPSQNAPAELPVTAG